MKEKSSGLIPIFVGVTGHRDVADAPGLAGDFAAVLQDISRQYPASPLVLLTPLAEGADRAAARAVLELKAKGMMVDYVTILPMEEERYICSFSGPNSTKEYLELKNQGRGSFQVPLPDTLAQGGDELMYANLGAYLAQNTQILIAAWNGAEESTGHRMPVKPGGTYHVLRIRFFGAEDQYRDANFLSGRESGPVYWIKTKRLSSDYLAGGEAMVGPAYPSFPILGEGDSTVTACFDPGQSRERTYADILTKLNAYNWDCTRLSSNLQAAIIGSQQEFFTPSPGEGLALPDGCSLVEHYAAADCLSTCFQKRRRRDILLLVVMALLGLLAYSLYSGPLPAFAFILGYTGLYGAAIGFYLLGVKPARNHEKYVDYRGIAEALRVQYFWGLAGIEAEVTDVYLARQMSSASWIKVAIANILLLSRAVAGEGQSADPWEAARRLWLEKQKCYYERKQPLKHRAQVAQKGVEAGLFGLGLSAALLLAGADTLEALFHGTMGVVPVFPLCSSTVYSLIHQWVIFAVGFLPVIIASYKVFTELMAYAKLARNYRWMRMVYSTGLKEYNRFRINYADQPGLLSRKLGKLLYDIGVEALAENEEWIGILDDRAPELPK
jgi:hypothetical protein